MKEKRQEEKLYVDKVEKYMKQYFDTTREVWSKCGKGRIDLLLKLKDREVYFGIECKIDNEKRGAEMGEFIDQAMRYAKYEFEVKPNTYKRIPIAICPALSYAYFILNEKEFIDKDGKSWHRDRHSEFVDHHSINGFLGVWLIGEIRPQKKDGKFFYILSWSNKPVWSSENVKIWDDNIKKYIGTKTRGLHEKWYELLMKKII
jgi:hypothetical protein